MTVRVAGKRLIDDLLPNAPVNFCKTTFFDRYKLQTSKLSGDAEGRKLK